MILLRLLSLPYLRKHVLRWMLTLAGIMLGVAVFVAMHATNGSVIGAFNNTVNRIAGATQLQITAGDFGFPEEILERVQAIPEVRVAVPVLEAVGDSGIRGQGNLLILGVDMTGDRSLRDYDLESGDEEVIDDPLVFLAQPDSLILTQDFAGRNGIASGDHFPMQTVLGERQFTVRGIMKAGGIAQAFGGNLAIMDIYAAQHIFGRGRRFDRIDLALQEGISLDAGRAAIERELGPGFTIAPPSSRGQQFEAMLQGYTVGVNISSLFALFIGMFIIYNSFSIAVTQRRSEIGTLRALGATQKQIRTLFLAESAVAGLVGSVAGAAAGLAIAHALVGPIGGLLQEVYGVAQQIEEVPFDRTLVFGGILLGIAASMFGAWLPARNAARVDPVQALQKGRYQVLSAGENRVRRIVAFVLMAAAILCIFFETAGWVFYAGYFLAVLAALLLTPTLAHALASALRPFLRRVLPVEGTLAADSLIQAPRRTSSTVAALMLSLAMVLGFGGVADAFYVNVVRWMDGTLNPDLFVAPSENLVDRAYTFPAEVGEEIRQVDGVDEVQLVRSARIPFRGTPVTLVATEVFKISRRVQWKPIEGDEDQMYAKVARGEGVVISDGFAGLREVKYGETIEIPTPNGPLRLPVVGIVRDYSDQQGSMIIDRALFIKWWNDDTVGVVRVYLRPGVSSETAKERILERFSGVRRLFVLTNRDLREYILRVVDQWFSMTYNQIAVAILVAVLGIVNTLTVSITDRRRELGVLQAVGGLRQQIRHTIWLEALLIGVIGLILGLGLGALNLYYTLGMLERDLAGVHLEYQFPFNLYGFLIPVILVAAYVASLLPAESAVRGSLVEALEYE